jgi:hypothetical protein
VSTNPSLVNVVVSVKTGVVGFAGFVAVTVTWMVGRAVGALVAASVATAILWISYNCFEPIHEGSGLKFILWDKGLSITLLIG